MFKHVFFRIVAGLILLAAITGIAFFAYQAGAAHAVAGNLQAPVAGTAEAPYLFHGMPYGPFMWFPGFGFFGFLGLLIPLFFVFLAFSAMRHMLWGPRWGWRHMEHNPMRHGPWEQGVPPMFVEMHHRAHAAEADEQTADKKPEA